MGKTYVDCYGFRRVPGGNHIRREPRAYQSVASSDGTATYVRHTSADACAIWRIDSGDGTIAWAFGEWSAREGLDYSADTNTLLPVGDDLLGYVRE